MISLGALAQTPPKTDRPTRLRNEILAALAEVDAPVTTTALLSRVPSTRHPSRLGAELRVLEREGHVVFTARGWMGAGAAWLRLSEGLS